MDRKSKIWIWVLALLLIAALVTSVLFKLKLDNTKETLAFTQEQWGITSAENEASKEQLTKAQEALAQAQITDEPTDEPTDVPTVAPTAAPTAMPTAAVTATPTANPTAVPSAAPTATAKVEATEEPTGVELAAMNVTEPVYIDRAQIAGAIERLRGIAGDAPADETTAQMDAIYADMAKVDEAIAAIRADAATSDDDKTAAIGALAGDADAIRARLDAAYREVLAKLIDAGDEQAALDVGAVDLRLLTREVVALQTEIDNLTAQLETASAESGAEVTALGAEIAEKQAALDAANEQLADAAAQIEALTLAGAEKDTSIADLTGKADASASEVEELTGELAAANGEVERLTGELEAAQGERDSLAAELQIATGDKDALATELMTAEDGVAALTAELGTAQEGAAKSEADLAAANEELVSVRAELESAAAALAATQVELSDTKTQLDDVRAELDAFKLKYAVGEGQSHASADIGAEVQVASDGVTAIYALTNTTLSGNSVRIELKLEGEVIYTSPALKPGEVLPEFALTKTLAAGTYEAVVGIQTLNAAGEVASTINIPVAIVVAP